MLDEFEEKERQEMAESDAQDLAEELADLQAAMSEINSIIRRVNQTAYKGAVFTRLEAYHQIVGIAGRYTD